MPAPKHAHQHLLSPSDQMEVAKMAVEANSIHEFRDLFQFRFGLPPVLTETATLPSNMADRSKIQKLLSAIELPELCY